MPRAYPDLYRADDDWNPVIETEGRPAWSKWYFNKDQTVAKTLVGPLRVSTVFLGIDKRMTNDGAPILFETVVFSEARDFEQVVQMQYSTVALARHGHAKVVDKLRVDYGIAEAKVLSKLCE